MDRLASLEEQLDKSMKEKVRGITVSVAHKLGVLLSCAVGHRICKGVT